MYVLVRECGKQEFGVRRKAGKPEVGSGGNPEAHGSSRQTWLWVKRVGYGRGWCC